MNPSVRSVTAWNPDALRATATELDDLVGKLDNRMRGLLNDQDVLAEQWKGEAANAAALRVVRERSLGSAIAGALLQVADAYRTGAPIVEGARMHMVGLVRAAESQSFTVHDNGIVDAAKQASLLRALLPPGATYDTASLQLERQAAELSVALVDALQQAKAAADDATGRLNAAIAVLEDAAEAATPGEVVRSDDGTFSWVPDVPATVAASTIGVMTDVTDKALTSATISAGDDLAVRFSKGLSGSRNDTGDQQLHRRRHGPRQGCDYRKHRRCRRPRRSIPWHENGWSHRNHDCSWRRDRRRHCRRRCTRRRCNVVHIETPSEELGLSYQWNLDRHLPEEHEHVRDKPRNELIGIRQSLLWE